MNKKVDKSKEKYNEWYRACDFIKREMQFYSIKDFWENADMIRYYFKHCNSYTRQLYQWYVFANVNINYAQKCEIWDFITE